ncbi:MULTISPECIES: GntR family transcriptional regulator [unclassified Gemella]|uniref:GntR family transcriptional regulator n=1 Tax=unclassified Gemella TaxID=2624949 RepID=UPI0015CFFD36|nr:MULTISPECIES: GntR family transcriptional regulator [unclassified Gemella]MBF0710214.1 GntR family transcriptional regulator [Gemella sp. GL1.1]NYS27558.1 GntR family transcriptional regulator [Gemella sp. GL1]
MSKYKQVYINIKNKIDTGVLKSNQELPTENELMKKFGFSKDTIRRALSKLELDGYIQKNQGKNSIVLEHGRIKNNYLTEIKTSSELNKNNFYNIKTKQISFDTIQGQLELMNIFKVDATVDFYKICRSREIDGEKMEYETSYFDRRIVPYLNKEIVEESIYKYLETELKLKITHSRREISFRYATEEEKENMDLGEYNMVVVVTSFSYLSSGKLFQYGTICYRPDKFTFVTIAKR